MLFVLSGSCQFELQKTISESLAGRCAIVDMASMTQIEIEKSNGSLFDVDIGNMLEKERRHTVGEKSRKAMFECIFNGSMPDVVVGNTEREKYYKSYQKEIDLLFIKDDTVFPIEIKSGIDAGNSTRNFSVLRKFKMNVGTGLVIENCDKIRPLAENVYSYPVYMLGV